MDLKKVYIAINNYERDNDIKIPLSRRRKIIQTIENLDNDLEVQKYYRNEKEEMAYYEGIIETINTKSRITGKYGTEEDARIHYGDIKHINFFDVFMYDGATKELLNVLKEHGLPTDILKGIRAYQDADNLQFNHNGKNGRIHLTWTELSIGGKISKYIEEFWIEYDGEKIIELDGSFGQYSFRTGFYKKEDEDYVKTYGNIVETRRNGKTTYRYKAGTIIKGVKVGGQFVSEKQAQRVKEKLR